MEWRILPEELQENILSRVPTKIIARFRSTSKRWINALIKSRSFAKIQSANAPKESLIILLMDYKVYLAKVNLHGIRNNVASSVEVSSQLYLKDPHFKSSQVNIHNIFHCNGLLLCTTNDNRLMVWNPCLGVTNWIKPRNHNRDYEYYALGYCNKSSCKQYKILRVIVKMYYQRNSYKTQYEIFDFTSEYWRVLGKSTDWLISGSGHGVSMKGNAYWIALGLVQPYHYPKFLLSFDFSKESFQRLSLPQPFLYICQALSVVRDDQLCLLGCHSVDTNSAELHVWMTTTSTESVMSWSKFLTVRTNHSSFNKVINTMSFLVDEQNKVVVCCSKYWVANKILHIVRENNHIQHVYHHVGNSERISSCLVLMNYVPSLARIQQGKPFRGSKKKATSTS